MRSTLALHSGHNAAQHNQHLAVFTTKKGIKDGQGGRRATVFSVPLLALSIALTCFSVAFWVTKEGVWGREGGGSLANIMALSHFPSFFHSDKNEPRPQGLGWGPCESPNQSRIGDTRGKRHKLMGEGGEKGFWWTWHVHRHFKTWFGLSLSFAVLHQPNPVPTKLLWTGQVCLPR